MSCDSATEESYLLDVRTIKRGVPGISVESNRTLCVHGMGARQYASSSVPYLHAFVPSLVSPFNQRLY